MSQLKYWDGTAWVDAVIGAQGTTGIQGAQGLTGAGSQGVQGTRGLQGTIGAQGISGVATDFITPLTPGIAYGGQTDQLTAFGIKAGYSLSDTGATVTLIGGWAGSQQTNQLNNTAVGHYALKNLSGNGNNENTAIGAKALEIVDTSAYGNTVLGSLAANTLTDGSNNIVIGSGAQPSAASKSNEITIGNATNDRLRIPGLSLDTSTAANGQVLGWNTSLGTAGGFEWTSGGGGGGKVLISTTTAPGNSFHQITVPSGYTQLQLVYQDLVCSFGAVFQFRGDSAATLYTTQATEIATQKSANTVSSRNNGGAGPNSSMVELVPYPTAATINGVVNIYNYDALYQSTIFADWQLSIVDSTPEQNMSTSSIIIQNTNGVATFDTIEVYGGDSGSILLYGIM